MALARTEQLHREAKGIDARDPREIAGILVRSQLDAAACVLDCSEALSEAAGLAAAALRGGGRLAYCGAGSSGLMGLVDGLEIPGTFGLPEDRIVMLVAGGTAGLAHLEGGYEDDADQARADVRAAGLGAGDCLIAVTASGSTPYAVAGAGEARSRGARVVALCNNPDAPLFAGADVSILLRTPPEVVAGSTRLGAGTAQKIALNVISTLTGIALGHVYDGYMVNLRPDNRKLKRRAGRIVAELSGASEAEAGRLLEAAGGSVKAAILLAGGAGDAERARAALTAADQNLRRARAALGLDG